MIVKPRLSKRSKYVGYVVFDTEENAQEARKVGAISRHEAYANSSSSSSRKQQQKEASMWLQSQIITGNRQVVHSQQNHEQQH